MQNDSFKKIVLDIPEYLLIAAVMFYWISTGLAINYIAILLLTILVLQMVFKNKVIGVLVPVVLIILCLYMILAVISEVSEFPSFNSEAKTLLVVGLAYFMTTILVSAIMIYKYAIASKKPSKA